MADTKPTTTIDMGTLAAWGIPHPLALRMVDRIHVDGECWRWPGGTRVRGGYVQVRYGQGPKWLIHRLVYMLTRGPIPEGAQIDHLCRVADCCRPDHLEAVTALENIRRRDAARVERDAKRDREVNFWRDRALRAEALLARS